MDARLQDLVADDFRLNGDAIRDDLKLDQTEIWDFLRQMEFVLSIERVFQVQLSSEEIFTMRHLGEVQRILRAKGAIT